MRSIPLIILTYLLFLPGLASAEALTLDQVVQKSLEKSTGLYRIQREYNDKIADSVEKRLIDNPELQTDFERGRNGSGTGYNVELTQPLKFSNLSGSRLRYSNILKQVADSEQQYEILRAINDTTVLYTRLWLLQERKKLYEHSAKDAESLSKLIKSATKQGQTSPAASHLFSSDAIKLKADAQAVDSEQRQARTELAKLTGVNFQKVELKRPVFSAVPNNLDKLTSFAESRYNLRNLLKSRINAAEQRVAIADQDAALPEIGPRLVYSRTPNGDEEAYGVGIAMRIPLWNQNDGERRRAKAELAQAKSENALLNGLPQKEVIVELQESAQTLNGRANDYFDKILPGYRKSYELTRAMFRQGQVGALEVWQIREKLYQTENEALSTVAEAVNARNLLELEIGGKLEEVK